MHTAFLRAGGKIDECPMCIDEHANPRNPNFTPVDLLASNSTTRYPIPCETHGDPRFCLPGNRDAFDLYLLMNQNDNYIYRQVQQGGKTVMKSYLDLNICMGLCHEWGIDGKDTIEKLTIIHQELRG